MVRGVGVVRGYRLVRVVRVVRVVRIVWVVRWYGWFGLMESIVRCIMGFMGLRVSGPNNNTRVYC